MKYLKEEQYYIDLYDLVTIKECLRVVAYWRKAYKEKVNSKEIKKLPKKEKVKGFQYFLNMELFTTKASRFKHRKESIAKLMRDDRIEQEKYDSTPAPNNIHCLSCGAKMQTKFKMMDGGYSENPFRVLFFFDCPSCKKRRAIYEDGEEDLLEPSICKKCKKEVETKESRKGNIITFTTHCPSCGFDETEIEDLDKHKAEREKREKDDSELLKKYREEFCLSEKEGAQHIEFIESMQVASEVYEEEKQKYDDSAYQTVVQLKRLSIVDLEKLLHDHLDKEQYVKLSLDKPDIGQHVIVPFSIQDANSSREPHASTKRLEEVLKPVLEETNWRLEPNHLSYRLGYISGQIKGYEKEEDLVALSGKKKEQKKSKLDPEQRSKYASHNIVQLSRIMGKHAGIEEIRKKRLEQEPEGFFLTSHEGPLTCGICDEVTPGDKIWWDLNGIRCADCQRNMKEGVFPVQICNDRKLWVKEFQFKYDYSIHPSMRRKFVKEGVLKARDLKRQDGKIYSTIYLVKENKAFFKKYPKKPEMKVEWKTSDKEGNEVKM
jgi:hypothetical protein